MLVKTGAAYEMSVDVDEDETVCEPAVRAHASEAPEPSAARHVALVCENETTVQENCNDEPYVMETASIAQEESKEERIVAIRKSRQTLRALSQFDYLRSVPGGPKKSPVKTTADPPTVGRAEAPETSVTTGGV